MAVFPEKLTDAQLLKTLLVFYEIRKFITALKRLSAVSSVYLINPVNALRHSFDFYLT